MQIDGFLSGLAKPSARLCELSLSGLGTSAIN